MAANSRAGDGRRRRLHPPRDAAGVLGLAGRGGRQRRRGIRIRAVIAGVLAAFGLTGCGDRHWRRGVRIRAVIAGVLAAAFGLTGCGDWLRCRGHRTRMAIAAVLAVLALAGCEVRHRRRGLRTPPVMAAVLAALALTGCGDRPPCRGLRTRPMIAAVLVALALTGCGDRLRQHEFTAMSTVVRASVYHRQSPDWAALESAAHAYAALYDHRDPASPVAQLSRAGAAELDPLAAATLSRAVQLAAATGGAFDPTILPVTRLWDFDHGGTLPDEAALRAALARVDFRRLQVTGGAATLHDAELDLGAIGKGAVLDHLADWLAERGYRRFLLEAGGDVLVSDLKPDGTQWRIWIRHPRSADAPLAIATIGAAGERAALATSGDYERFLEHDGVRYHHILNPVTGHPDSDAVSVSVIAPSALEADAPRDGVIRHGQRRRRVVAQLPRNRRGDHVSFGRGAGGADERAVPGAAGQRSTSTDAGPARAAAAGWVRRSLARPAKRGVYCRVRLAKSGGRRSWRRSRQTGGKVRPYWYAGRRLACQGRLVWRR